MKSNTPREQEWSKVCCCSLVFTLKQQLRLRVALYAVLCSCTRMKKATRSDTFLSLSIVLSHNKNRSLNPKSATVLLINTRRHNLKRFDWDFWFRSACEIIDGNMKNRGEITTKACLSVITKLLCSPKLIYNLEHKFSFLFTKIVRAQTDAYQT